MTKISRASLRSYTTTHLTYRPPDEARRLLHEHANAIILQAGKAIAEILPESEASVAALDALGIARMRCNQAIAHDECDVAEAKARIAKSEPGREIAEALQAAAKEMGEALAATGQALGKLAIVSGDPELLRSLGLKGQVVLSQSIRSEDPERVFDGIMKANAAKMKRVSLRDLDYGATDKATRAAAVTPDSTSVDAERIAQAFMAPLQRLANLSASDDKPDSDADEHRGLYGKFFVRRADGRDDRHCSYFVLRMDDGRKPWDVAALQAYADALPKAYAKLATDLRAVITEIEEEVDAEFAGDLPEGFDRQEALSELAGYGFENGTLLKCSDAELSHLVGQWRRFKAANTKAAEAKALAGLREIFGKFDLSADEAIESVRILMAERKATDAALSRSIAETPLSNDGTLIERLDRRLQEADSDHRAYRAFVGLHDDVVSACRGLVDACRALGWPDDDATVATPGRGETSTLLAEIGAATAALSKWKDLRTDDHPSWHDFEVTKAERNGLRSLLAEVGALLLGPAGVPTAASVLDEAKALRGMVDGEHRLSVAFVQAGRQAEVKAKALSLLKVECEDVDAQIVMLEALLLGLDTGNPRTREDRVIALVEEAKRIRHLVDGMGCPSKLSDIIAGRAKRANASNKDAFERGRADGQADVAARLRKLLDPSDEHKLSLDGLLKSVGYLIRVEDSLNAVVSPDGKAPVRVDCPLEGMIVRRGWNGVRLGGDAEEVTPVYLCARDGGWEWHDGDEKWRPLSAEANDEQAFADGRKQGIADVRKAIANIEHNATYGANDKPVPRREDVLRLIDALGGTPPRAGELPEAEARELSDRAVGVRHSVGLLLLSTRQIGKKVAEWRALDDAKRNQWIVDNKLWEPQEATPVGGGRLRVPNVSVFAEAAPGVQVSVANPIPVMVGVERGDVVSYAVDIDGLGGEVFVNNARWDEAAPITICRVIE